MTACTRGRRAKKHCASARDHRYRRIHSGLPCAVGYGLLRALLGELCLIATVAVMRPLEPHDSLTPSLSAPEPHDFIRPRRCRSPHDTDPSTTFRTTSAAIARRPSRGAERKRLYGKSEFLKRQIFLRHGVDRSFARPLVGQISCRTTPLARGRPPRNLSMGLGIQRSSQQLRPGVIGRGPRRDDVEDVVSSTTEHVDDAIFLPDAQTIGFVPAAPLPTARRSGDTGAIVISSVATPLSPRRFSIGTKPDGASYGVTHTHFAIVPGSGLTS